MTRTVLFKKIEPDAIIPTRGSEHSAGLDLHYYGQNDISIVPGGRQLLRTGIAWAADPGVYGRIAPRSGLAYKHGLDILAGVIDADYRDEIRVLITSLNGHLGENGQPQMYVFQPGDRIAQLIITPYVDPEIIVSETLPESVRGATGFGSTGK